MKYSETPETQILGNKKREESREEFFYIKTLSERDFSSFTRKKSFWRRLIEWFR